MLKNFKAGLKIFNSKRHTPLQQEGKVEWDTVINNVTTEGQPHNARGLPNDVKFHEVVVALFLIALAGVLYYFFH